MPAYVGGAGVAGPGYQTPEPNVILFMVIRDIAVVNFVCVEGFLPGKDRKCMIRAPAGGNRSEKLVRSLDGAWR